MVAVASSPANFRIVTEHLAGRIRLATGLINFTGEERFVEPIEPGLKIVVVLTGHTILKLGEETRIGVEGPVSLVFLAAETTAREQIFMPDATYRYALVDVDPALVREELGVEPRSFFPDKAGSLAVSHRPASKTVQAIASQIMACPATREQNIYRCGKAVELTALVLDEIRSVRRGRARGRLSTADIDRINLARDILLGRASDPPDVATLAAAVGLNVRKLNNGFRFVFGATPYAFLQEHRLQTAYRLLSSGEASVGACAHRVGYAPTHLATLFVRRFGLPPSALIPPSGMEGS